MTAIDEFNALYDAVVSGAITEREFCALAIERCGYIRAEISLVARRIRQRRPGDVKAALPCGDRDRRVDHDEELDHPHLLAPDEAALK